MKQKGQTKQNTKKELKEMSNRTSFVNISSTGLTDYSAPIKLGGIRYTDGSASVQLAVCFGDQVKNLYSTG